MNIPNSVILAAMNDGLTVAELFERLMNETGAVASIAPQRPKPEPWGHKDRVHMPVASRRTFNRVAYVLKVGRGGKAPNPDFGGFATAERAYKAILKAKGPLTVKDIERITGMPMKTVESVVYYLRHAKLIESKAL